MDCTYCCLDRCGRRLAAWATDGTRHQLDVYLKSAASPFHKFLLYLHIESPIIPTGLMNEVAEDPSSRSKHPHLSSLANYRSHPSLLDSRGHVSLTLSSSRSRLLPGPPPISVGAPASIATSLVLIQAIVFDSALPFRNTSAWADQSSGIIVFAFPMDGQFLTTAQDVAQG